MALFLPGFTHPREICSLCDAPARFLAVIRIRITDPLTSKMIATQIDLYVCEQHSVEMEIEVLKSLKDNKKIIIV